jgi:hypothetical protein
MEKTLPLFEQDESFLIYTPRGEHRPIRAKKLIPREIDLA